MATQSSRCKACGTRTSSSTGYCQRCKSLRHHGYKRIKADNLILDQAGGSWWIWNARGDVLVAGKPTAGEAVIALSAGEGDVEDDEDHATKKSATRLVNIVTDTKTLAAAMYPGGGLDAFNTGVYESTKIPVRKLTGREVVTVAGTTAGARVLADETWIADRFGTLGARQIQALRGLTLRENGRWPRS